MSPRGRLSPFSRATMVPYSWHAITSSGGTGISSYAFYEAAYFATLQCVFRFIAAAVSPRCCRRAQ